MRQLPRCVQRIDVDDDETGAKYAAHGHRVLQQVGEHDRDTFATRKSEVFLQIAGELHRQPIKLRVVERATHVGVGGVVRILLESLLKQIPHRLERWRGNLFWHAGRIGLEPHFFQIEDLFAFRLLVICPV